MHAHFADYCLEFRLGLQINIFCKTKGSVFPRQGMNVRRDVNKCDVIAWNSS